ncbi:hypothetical protein GCM10011354_06620 [Egicoccus halophilus]|uniref:Uncharacterized protein n=1 Tax=Egicoccus halophilus TaxID=1670830 RepID=A0A8J3EWL8_9ACTN|nr:hypothetical protein GCM10011354_06620 [Egicoccus halophilus]
MHAARLRQSMGLLPVDVAEVPGHASGPGDGERQVGGVGGAGPEQEATARWPPPCELAKNSLTEGDLRGTAVGL